MEGMDSGETQPMVRWGLGHVALGILFGMVASVAAMSLVVAIQGSDDAEDPSLLITSLVQSCLYLGLLCVPVWLVATKGVSWTDLGLVRGSSRTLRDARDGLVIGVLAQLFAVPLLYMPILLLTDDLDVSGPARELVDRAEGVSVALLVVMVVLLAPVVEELFFRGLALRAFEARLSRRLALVSSALLFGVTHFQLLQLPALVMIGLVCGTLAQRDGHLGRAVWAHVGFNAVTTAVLL